MTNHDVAYVTQEMWDRAQDALKAALPMIDAHTPPLSTAGTMVSLRAQVRAAIVGAGVEAACANCPRLMHDIEAGANEIKRLAAENAHLASLGGAALTQIHSAVEPGADCTCTDACEFQSGVKCRKPPGQKAEPPAEPAVAVPELVWDSCGPGNGGLWDCPDSVNCAGYCSPPWSFDKATKEHQRRHPEWVAEEMKRRALNRGADA